MAEDVDEEFEAAGIIDDIDPEGFMEADGSSEEGELRWIAAPAGILH